MDIHHLRTFCAAARLGSVSKAAQVLDISQPTATLHIKKLEKDLGTDLFDRTRRPLEPTPTGKALLRMAEPLVQGMDLLVSEIRAMPSKGTLSIAIAFNLTSVRMLTVLREFRAALPDMRLLLTSCPREEALHRVKSGEADAGLIPGVERDTDLRLMEIAEYERVLIAPIGHPIAESDPITLADIARYPLIVQKGSFTWALLEDAFLREGLPYRPDMEVEGMDGIKRWVAAGLGISVGPSLSIDPEDHQRLAVISVSHLLPRERLTMAVLREAPANPHLERLRASLANALASAPSRL